MTTPQVFVDSDVVISSLISRAGAAYLLLNEIEATYYVSDLSQRELKIVTKRLGLDVKKLEKMLKRFKIVKLKTSNEKLKKNFADYIIDPNDAHIVAGSVRAGATFLISYNLRHFRVDKIKADFNITSLTPANFLQYLRSL